MKSSSPQLAESLKNQLDSTQKELTALRAALNAHAIVAVTDKRGVITEVNEKFCQISGYFRDELLGNTHQIINSGRHSKAFFDNLWRTISSGQVWQGEVCNKAKNNSLYWVATTIVPFTGDDDAPAQYVSIRADITQRKLAEQKARKMALYDPLTNLPNRRLLTERLQEADQLVRSNSHSCALILLDLDHFKDINDTLGHNQGDELLCMVANRLSKNVRESDTVARLGGDEFVVLLEHLDNDLVSASAQAKRIAEKLRSAMAQNFVSNGRIIHSTVSMGITLLSNETPQQDILKQADIALYRAKDMGRNQTCLFDASLQLEVEQQAKLIADLRQAVAQQEFCLYYQPVVNVTGISEGYEALLRWKHPKKGLITPADFIRQLEKSGLILPVGKWVLETACHQLAVWGQNESTAHLTLAINVSAKQFLDPNFVSDVKKALADSCANPQRLYLELTESTFYHDIDHLIEKMRLLKHDGIRCSLDDFGTGYSSMNYLKRLPLDRLKIDQSFIRNIPTDPNDAAIVRSILGLAKILDMDVVAEGVETIEQADFLRSIDCTIYQGYLFGKPMPLEALPI